MSNTTDTTIDANGFREALEIRDAIENLSMVIDQVELPVADEDKKWYDGNRSALATAEQAYRNHPYRDDLERVDRLFGSSVNAVFQLRVLEDRGAESLQAAKEWAEEAERQYKSDPYHQEYVRYLRETTPVYDDADWPE